MEENSNVRPSVQDASRFTKEPGDMTIGDLARWSAAFESLQPLSPPEQFLVSEQWMVALMAIATKQGMESLGGLAYIVDQETQLLLEKEQQK